MTKLTLVSVTWKGKCYSVFTHLPVDADGKIRRTSKILEFIYERLGVQRGDTIGIH